KRSAVRSHLCSKTSFSSTPPSRRTSGWHARMQVRTKYGKQRPLRGWTKSLRACPKVGRLLSGKTDDCYPEVNDSECPLRERSSKTPRSFSWTSSVHRSTRSTRQRYTIAFANSLATERQ